MEATWIQFALLMLTILGFALRNEHRMTMLEGKLTIEETLRSVLEKRIDKLEDKK